MTRQRLPHQLQIAGDRVRASRLRKPDRESDDGEQHDQQRGSRGKTKAANGDSKTSADGQEDGNDAKRRRNAEYESPNQNLRPAGLLAC